MNVALIEPVGGHGGMDHYDYGLAQGLSENDVSVHFYTCSETEQRNITHVFVHRVFGHVWRSPNKWVKLWRYLKGHWSALRLAKKSGCQIVHLHFFSFDWLNFLVTFVVNLFGFKKVLTIHDVSDFRGGGSSVPRNYVLASFDHLIVHNAFSRNELKQFHKGNNVSVIPHGHYLHSVEELPYQPNHSEPLKLLFFGQIKKVKGLDVLLRAMNIVVKENPDVQLQIAGKVWHDDLQQYQHLITELKLENHVKTNFSFIPNDEVSDYFKDADVVVLPYRQIYQSGVLLLSMSYGRPVITSDLKPFAEVLENGNTGFLFPSEDEKSLANTILELVSERRILQSIAANASRKLKTEFDWGNIGAFTRTLYASIE